MEFNSQFLIDTLPVLVLVFGGLLVMVLDAFKMERTTSALTILSLLLSMTLAIPGVLGSDNMTLTFYNMIYSGGLAGLIHIFLCLSALLSVPFITEYLNKNGQQAIQGEINSLILFSVIGMNMLATANDLVVMFIGLEIMSVCLYIMAGSFKRDLRSNEAGLKYFLLGAFTTGFLLYGIALIYGMTGTTMLHKIAQASPNLISDKFPMLFYPALFLLVTGFLFKLGAFPFHVWSPDVYTGAPTPMVGFMATGSKMASVIALGMVLNALLPSYDKINYFIALLAVLSMIYGNIVAAQQTNIKRLLAYSSISHTGYMLLGVAAGPEGYKSAIFYMLTYTFMTIAAFALISAIETREEDLNYENWKGIGTKNTAFGILFSVLLFSLAGMPPLAGFIAKYFVFLSAVKGGWITFAVIGILSSVIGAYYYLRVLVMMYFEKPQSEPLMSSAPALSSFVLASVGLLALLVVLIGIYPSPINQYLDLLYGKAGLFARLIM